MPTPESNPFGVFANNELNMGGIEVYGFDYDYTLAVYTGQLHYLIYDLGRDWLINKFKVPFLPRLSFDLYLSRFAE